LNPNSPYHPSRLVVQFPPGGIPDNLRPDPSKIVAEINNTLASNQSACHLKVVAANFNTQGNLIMSTRSDQTANDLLKFKDLLTPILSRLGNNIEVQLREDRKWFKIQIDAVSTRLPAPSPSTTNVYPSLPRLYTPNSSLATPN
jgi:hypothetical protein